MSNASTTTPGMAPLALFFGALIGAGIGNQFHPLPHGWRGLKTKQDRMNFAKTAAVGGVFAAVGAGIGYALIGCDCCPSVGGLGTPLQVPVTTPTSPGGNSGALPPGTPR